MSDDRIRLAGERIRLEMTESGTTVTFNATGTGRVCGGCTLCCRVLPVDLNGVQKPAGTRCQHCRTGHGCRIYDRRPWPCATFACRWLADPMMAGMPRPDRAHYVVDVDEDYVTLRDPATGEGTQIGVMQVWLDPNYPDAHRAPELRAYMLRLATEFRLATIVRFSSYRAVTVFPPPLSTDHEWHEVEGAVGPRNQVERNIMVRLDDGREITRTQTRGEGR
jgi:hypothetical protein